MLTLLLKFALRNTLRHRLRSILTLAGIVVAVLAFGLLQTVVSAWYAGVDAASDKRLVTRHAISITFAMPYSYAAKVRKVEGVSGVSWMNWFGGIYIDERNFFPQFAVDAESFFGLYPEFLLSDAALRDFRIDRRGAIIGAKLARRYGWKVGDVIPLKGTIFSGNWDFVVRGIYTGRLPSTDENQMFFQWNYFNETLKQRNSRMADHLGILVIGIRDGRDAASISAAIDESFRNSLAETLTETEKAFQLSFVAMLATIIQAIRIVSYLVIVIIMAVMANTMAMAARERTAEYATLKTLGFAPRVVGLLVYTESLCLALAGGVLGIMLTGPLARAIGSNLDNIFPVFIVAPQTVWQQWGAAVLIGFAAALIPAFRAMRVTIVDGLRAI